jgi:hypothetical protein
MLLREPGPWLESGVRQGHDRTQESAKMRILQVIGAFVTFVEELFFLGRSWRNSSRTNVGPDGKVGDDLPNVHGIYSDCWCHEYQATMAQSVARRSHNNRMIGKYPEVMGSIPIGRKWFCRKINVKLFCAIFCLIFSSYRRWVKMGVASLYMCGNDQDEWGMRMGSFESLLTATYFP